MAQEGFRLGDWRVHPSLHQLERDGDIARLEPKVMELLVILASRPRQIFTKEELFKKVWRGAYVTGEVLTNAIWELRRALGDRAKDSRYIETIPRRGYRLLVEVGPLEPVSSQGPEQETAEVSVELVTEKVPAGPPAEQPEPTRPSRWRPGVQLFWALPVLLAVVLGWLFFRRSDVLGGGETGSGNAARVPVSSAGRSDALAATQAAGDSATKDPAAVGSSGSPVSEPVAPAPQPFWRFKTGGEIWSSPTLAMGAVFFGSDDGYLYALEAASGAERWRFKTTGKVRGRPAFADGRLFLGSEDGHLYAVDAATGRELWRHSVRIVSPPVVTGENVFFAREGRELVCLSARSGEPLWAAPTGSRVEMAPGLADRRVFTGDIDGLVRAFDGTSGKILWEHKTGAEVTGAPYIEKGVVYLGTSGGYLLALDARDGRELWRAKTSEFVSSPPAVAGDKLLVGSGDGHVFAFDAERGSELWRLRTGDFVSGAPRIEGDVAYFGSGDQYLYAVDVGTGRGLWRFGTDNWITSSPEVGEGRVFFGGIDGYFYGVRRDLPPEPFGVQETKGWQLDIKNNFRDKAPRFLWRHDVGGLLFPPALASGQRVFIGTPHGLAALEADSGKKLWLAKTAGPVDGRAAEEAGLIYFGSRDGNFYAVDRDQGKELWRFRSGEEIMSYPVVGEGMVYFGSRDKNIYALDAKNGRERWRFPTGSVVHSGPAFDAGVVYAASCDHRLYALDAITGGELWRFEAEDCLVASPLVAGETLYIGDAIGNFYAIDKKTGQQRWRFASGGTIWFSPALEMGMVFFGSADYHLYAIDSTTGIELWRFRTGNRVLSSVVARQGVVYFGSYDRRLYAVNAINGEELWSFRTSRTINNVALSGRRLYASGADHHLYALELP